MSAKAVETGKEEHKKSLPINKCVGLAFGRTTLVVDRSSSNKLKYKTYGSLNPLNQFDKDWGTYMVAFNLFKYYFLLTVNVGTKRKISNCLNVTRTSLLFGIKIVNGNVKVI